MRFRLTLAVVLSATAVAFTGAAAPAAQAACSVSALTPGGNGNPGKIVGRGQTSCSPASGPVVEACLEHAPVGGGAISTIAATCRSIDLPSSTGQGFTSNQWTCDPAKQYRSRVKLGTTFKWSGFTAALC